MWKRFIFIHYLIINSILGSAQNKSDPAEIEVDKINKLAAFVGEWKSYSTTGASVSGTDTVISKCNWSSTGKYLLCEQIGIAPNKLISTDLAVFAYDINKNEYRFYIVGISGVQPFSYPLTINEKTWIYSREYKDNGKTIKSRTINIFDGTGNKVKYMVQVSKDDGETWQTTDEGVEVRASKYDPRK